MKALMIPPTPELGRFGVGDMHLVLAHLMTSRDYIVHYRNEAINDAYIILDNSAFELGASGYSVQRLLELAPIIGAQEIVLPDVLRDRQSTLDLTQDALREFVKLDEASAYKPMLVPQGDNPIGWSTCLLQMIQMCRSIMPGQPFVIGIPRHCADWEGGRYRLLDDYVQLFQSEFETHLLGWGTDLEEVANIARDFPWVRSIDSSKPFAWAFEEKGLCRNVPLAEQPDRPDDYFSLPLNDIQLKWANENVMRFRHAAEGTQLPVRID